MKSNSLILDGIGHRDRPAHCRADRPMPPALAPPSNRGARPRAGAGRIADSCFVVLTNLKFKEDAMSNKKKRNKVKDPTQITIG